MILRAIWRKVREKPSLQGLVLKPRSLHRPSYRTFPLPDNLPLQIKAAYLLFVVVNQAAPILQQTLAVRKHAFPWFRAHSQPILIAPVYRLTINAMIGEQHSSIKLQ
jgi:hypothetical protein